MRHQGYSNSKPLPLINQQINASNFPEVLKASKNIRVRQVDFD